ncbi:MAG: hypothetical protein ACXWG8_10310 [Usitatibacter sp.]
MEICSEAYRLVGNANVAIGATHAESATFRTISGDADPQIVVLTCDVLCFIAIGSNPVADNTGVMLSPNTYVPFQIKPDEKISVIQKSAAGTLSVAVCRAGAL